jgi:predicted phage tail protein
MKVVKVYGELKKRLGGKSQFKFDVRTPAEALKALCANFPGLDQWLLDSEKDGVAYKVLLGKDRIHEENVEKLVHPWSEKETFRITPVIAGAGGAGKFLAGAFLVGLAIVLPGAGMFAGGAIGFGATATTLGATLTAAAGNLGIYLMLSGVAQMLSPTPKTPDLNANKIKNYSFSGIINTTSQGFPVPICYGRCFTGSAVISAGLDVA